ncbi:patatin-like phospholipase family protein [Iodobacter ciconiae]|uniref:Patatin-like phospholipase family protein n=1 Tax=Iodobacter ciconiae TaxID=2496266 RepID=A0A3S8ZVM6_9NEIS|nr:patatin-like phospholipase family protein [Iodobacter ciconiae]AZN37464.1 patatin-like phospholipase family protein [Iodobacter ciconiae]
MAQTALIISGGAPNSTLIAGALEAFHELGVQIDVISTAGAGALLGLMYIAPKNGDVVSTLRGLKEMGVADFIYRAFPVNFKVFHKPGPMAAAYRQTLNPLLQMVQQWPASNEWAQTLKDSTTLTLASACPSNLCSNSLGLCAHIPFAEQIIDFNSLQTSRTDFWLNAYNLSQHQMENWPHKKIDVLHLQAALSFPYIYPPTEINGDFYIEGAAIDCLNFKGLRQNYPELKEIIIFNLLGAEKLLRKPKDLYDAWVMSIITPLVEIARDDIKLFEALHSDGIKLYKVPLIDAIANKDLPDVFNWSRSNMDRLYQTGYQTAKAYAKINLNHLIKK